LAFDNDDAGRSATDRVLKNIPWANVVKWPEDKLKGYDITDCFNDGEGFLETLGVYSEGPEEPNLGDYLRQKFDLSQKREPDIPLGYFLTNFKPLQENIDGVQPGLYIVGADTSYGKTSFVANLYLDLLYSNPDLTGIYFSLDDNRDIIINRLLAIQSGLPINLIQKRIDDETTLGKLRKAYGKLEDLSFDQRLYIYDQTNVGHVDEIEVYIKKNLRRKLFVIVDGLFNLDVKEGTDGSLRGLNIERANALKSLVDVYRIPLICTAELRKSSKGDSAKIPTPDDIMETGKFKYNANLILLLYPEDKDAYDNEDNPILKIKYAKNKLSHYRKTDQVTFLRACSRMEDMKRS
jgi:replicative DNA helicase